MKRFFLAGLLLSLAAGCARVPFQETPLVSLESRDPQAVVERFQASEPGSFQLLSTVVFEYNWRRFSVLSTLRVNRPGRTFTVAGMNPMGVKLFEFSGDPGGMTTQYAIPPLTRYGNIAAAVGNDIKRIYFDLVPAPGAKLWRRKCKLIFRQPSGPGFLEYVFAGENGDLIEKNYYENNGILWRIAYYEYRDQDGLRWPQGMVFTHYDYGYRLTVRHKEFHVEQN